MYSASYFFGFIVVYGNGRGHGGHSKGPRRGRRFENRSGHRRGRRVSNVEETHGRGTRNYAEEDIRVCEKDAEGEVKKKQELIEEQAEADAEDCRRKHTQKGRTLKKIWKCIAEVDT